MNEVHETYLKTYSANDKIDQMLLGWDVRYKSWRWWHAPRRHAKAIAMSMAYSLYLQCAEGSVDSDWKVCCNFRTKVLTEDFSSDGTVQVIKLAVSRGCKDAKATQINRKKQGIEEEALVECEDHIKRVSYSQYLDEKQPHKGKESRLCVDNLTLLKKHINSMKKVHSASCNMC